MEIRKAGSSLGSKIVKGGKDRTRQDSNRAHTNLNQVHNLGTPMPASTKTKYEYRITSVTLHATSILEYAGLYFVVCGKLYPIPQTKSSRLATCISVVKRGARTMPNYPIDYG